MVVASESGLFPGRQVTTVTAGREAGVSAGPTGPEATLEPSQRRDGSGGEPLE